MSYGGHTAFRSKGGSVAVHVLPKEDDNTDMALASFLALLEADLSAQRAEAILPLPEALASRLEALSAEVGEVDTDAPIKGDVNV